MNLTTVRPWRHAAPALGLLLAWILFLYRDTAVAMVTIWWRSETFTHGFLVPPIVLWLIWRQRHLIATQTPQPLFSVLALVAGVAFAWLLGDLVAVNAVTQLSLVTLLVLAVPAVVGVAPTFVSWPDGVQFLLQVVFAVVVLDIGITVAHWWSHRNDWLWRFHAVHHSATRMYGFNGLVKHPVHQAIETAAGMLPLVLLGVPGDVATAVAGLVVVQLLLQHSNVDYRVGLLRRWVALNEGHRLHHVARVPDGDVNFGLFLLIWDRLLGTYADPTARSVAGDELGIAGRAAYPVDYVDQLREPFRRPNRWTVSTRVDSRQ